VVAQHLLPEDALTARLVCRTWAQDLGAFVSVAKTLPTELLTACCPAQAASIEATAANCVSGEVESSETSHTTGNNSGGTSRAVACKAPSTSTSCTSGSSASSAPEGGSQQAAAAADGGNAGPLAVGVAAKQQHANSAAVAKLLAAFPHCQTLHVGISNAEQQQVSALLLDSLARCSTSTYAQASAAAAAAAAAAGDKSSLHAAPGVSSTTEKSQLVSGQSQQQQQQQQQQCVQVPRVVLDAVARSFHCKARQDCPTSPPGTPNTTYRALLIGCVADCLQLAG
jgi:hypothetical protein